MHSIRQTIAWLMASQKPTCSNRWSWLRWSQMCRSLDVVMGKSLATHKPSAVTGQGLARPRQGEMPSTEEPGLFYRMMYKPKEGMFCLPEASTFQFGKKLQVSPHKRTLIV